MVKNSKLFTNARKNDIPPRDTKQELRELKKMVFHIALEFSDCDEPFLLKLSESGKIIGRDADNRHAALAWDGDKVDFACAIGKRDP